MSNEPVAWAVTPTGKDEQIDCEFVYPSAATAGDVALGCDGVVVPLYREPKPALADQDATLSVCDGSVTVTMDGTLTVEEREAIKEAADSYDDGCNERCREITKIFRGLLERLGGGDE